MVEYGNVESKIDLDKRINIFLNVSITLDPEGSFMNNLQQLIAEYLEFCHYQKNLN